MKYLPIFFIALAILHGAYAPPVTPDKPEENKDDLAEYMEYHRYLNEVVQALESDPEFKSRLQMATEDEVRSGNVAHQLEFVNHNVRSQLDEIKRRELERLRHLTKKQHSLTLEKEAEGNALEAPSDEHLDQQNLHTFEIEDLKRLIKKVTTDLEKADKQRKEEFKEYEMKKEFEQHQTLEAMDEQHKREAQAKIDADKEARKHHKPLHHPGSKPQLEEVWEKQDHMEQKFDPKIFFMMHDVNGDGVWDADEVKALFIKELDKMYGPGAPNQDRAERAEEMERMREHVFYEVDRNRDGLIDFREFAAETQKADFNQDQGWQPIDENQIYTKNEYEEYEHRRREELRYLQNRGLVDAHGRPIPGLESQLHEARKAIPYNQHPQQAYHPQQGYPQAPPQVYHPQQPGYHPQQPPQQGYQPQQFAQQGFNPQQPPQQGYPPQQPPQQGHPPQQPAQQGHPPLQPAQQGHPPQQPAQKPQQPLQQMNQQGSQGSQRGNQQSSHQNGHDQAGSSNGHGNGGGGENPNYNRYQQAAGNGPYDQGPLEGPGGGDDNSPPGYRPHVPAGVPAPAGIPAPQGDEPGPPMEPGYVGPGGAPEPPPPSPPAPAPPGPGLGGLGGLSRGSH